VKFKHIYRKVFRCEDKFANLDLNGDFSLVEIPTHPQLFFLLLLVDDDRRGMSFPRSVS